MPCVARCVYSSRWYGLPSVVGGNLAIRTAGEFEGCCTPRFLSTSHGIAPRAAPGTMPGVLTVGLLGDVRLGRGVARELPSRRPEEVWSADVRELAGDCDLVIANLECCVSERGEPTRAIPDKPFFFRAPPIAVESLRAIGVRAVSLANNHALDYGQEALADTLELVGAAGIATAGAGRGADAARRGAVVEAGGRRVGLVAMTDHPRAYDAGPDSLGVAYADLREGMPSWVTDE